jgi:hypothetical protein
MTLNETTENLNPDITNLENKSDQELDYFILINRFLVTLLSGLIASAIVIGIFYLGQSMVGQAISENLNFAYAVIILIGIFIANQFLQLLLNYFYHLLQRETYSEIGAKSFQNLSLGIVGLLFSFVMLFVLFSQSLTAGTWTLIAFGVFSLVTGTVIRESNKLDLVLSNLTGTLLGTLALTFLMVISLNQSMGLAVIVGSLGLLIVSCFGSASEFVGKLILKILK